MPSSSNKIALFIDGANLYATAKTLGFRHRLQAPAQGIPKSRNAAGARFYYTAIIEDQEFSSIRPLIDWAGLQRLHRRHQGDQGIHRRQRAGAR